MESRDALMLLVDTALALVHDRAQKEALERVAQAQRRCLQERAQARRTKCSGLIMAIADLDLAAIQLQMQFGLIRDNLTPDAQNAIQRVLDELEQQRRKYAAEKKRISHGDVFPVFGGGTVPELPASTPGPSYAGAPEIVNGIAIYPGDVLAVTRQGGLYQHYAIYIGDWRVIHYAAGSGDFSGRISIHEAPFRDFKGDSDLFYALDFSAEGGRGIRRGELAPPPASDAAMSLLFEGLRQLRGYHLYTAEQTVERAKSRLGESRYSLPTNNCEHFALWCKTGVSESSQVEDWIMRFAKLFGPCL